MLTGVGVEVEVGVGVGVAQVFTQYMTPQPTLPTHSFSSLVQCG